jgi:hypothetical protein
MDATAAQPAGREIPEGILEIELTIPRPAVAFTSSSSSFPSCDSSNGGIYMMGIPSSCQQSVVLESESHFIQGWDILNHQLLWSALCRTSYGIIFSPASNKLLGWDYKHASAICVWDTNTGSAFSIGDVAVYLYCTFSNCGSNVMTKLQAPKDVNVVWSIDDAAKLFTITCSRNCHFSGDDRRIVSIRDYQMCVWDADTGAEMIAFDSLYGDYEGLDFSANGVLCSSMWRRQLGVWELETGSKIFHRVLPDDIRAVCFSQNNGSITAAYVNPTRSLPDLLSCWNLADGTMLYNVSAPGLRVCQIVSSPYDAKCYVLCLDGRNVREYDEVSGQETRNYESFEGRIFHLLSQCAGNILL